jgi:hypothetical protein
MSKIMEAREGERRRRKRKEAGPWREQVLLKKDIDARERESRE